MAHVADFETWRNLYVEFFLQIICVRENNTYQLLQVLRQLKIFMTWRIKMFLLKKFELTKYHLLKRRTRTPVWQKCTYLWWVETLTINACWKQILWVVYRRIFHGFPNFIRQKYLWNGFKTKNSNKKTTWKHAARNNTKRKNSVIKKEQNSKNADCGFTGRFAERFSGERPDPLGFELTFLSELKWVCFGGCLTAELCSALV